MIYCCSSAEIHSNFKDGCSIVEIEKIDFLFTCGPYLGNFVFIVVNAPLSVIDYSMLIGLPITP